MQLLQVSAKARNRGQTQGIWDYTRENESAKLVERGGADGAK